MRNHRMLWTAALSGIGLLAAGMAGAQDAPAGQALPVANAPGAPIRVVLMDFEDQTGTAPDARLGGAIAPGAIAEKGVLVMAQQLLGQKDYVLLDRREFLKQMDELRLRDGSMEKIANADLPSALQKTGRPTPVRPSFLQAAQALKADVVLRGSLVSFSSGGEKINQGGYQTDFLKVSLRVMLEALDAVDGTVIAVADGAASDKYRQTAEQQTQLSEDDIIGMLKSATAQATPALTRALNARVGAERSRPKVMLSVTTQDGEPAMVEIDGILVGSTPLENLEVYAGDHVLAVGRPGCQDVTKRLMLENATRITVPMLRTDLNADELKQVIEKMRMHINVGEPAILVETIR